MLNEDIDEDLEDGVKNLVDQLKEDQKTNKSIVKSEEFKLDKDNLEEFILNKTGSLINSSIEMVNTVKQYVEAAPNSEEVESLASLLRAATGSIDTLSKILVQDKRSSTTVKVKTMDIEAKSQLLEQDHHNKLLLSREDVLESLINRAEIIEADVIESDDQDNV